MLKTLVNEVRDIAQAELMPRFRQVDRDYKKDGSVITEADLRMQNRITEVLQSRWPEYALLGEEMEPQQQQTLLEQNTTGLWVLDPLDGTRNFAAGVPFFSVSIALLKHNHIELALVYDPCRDEAFYAQRGKGAWLNGERLQAKNEGFSLKQCLAVVDFKRLQPTLAANLAIEIPYASQRSFGSVALDWCWVAAGRVQIYLHGKQKLWDYAAGHLILQETGGVSADLQGEAVFKRSLTPCSAVAALDEELFRQWQTWIRANS